MSEVKSFLLDQGANAKAVDNDGNGVCYSINKIDTTLERLKSYSPADWVLFNKLKERGIECKPGSEYVDHSNDEGIYGDTCNNP